MSPFGKNVPKPGVTQQPPSPPLASAPSPTGGRKRITQRLVLGGKGVETGEINVGSGLKIPGAPDPVLSQVIPSASQGGTVDIPFSSLLGYIPAEFVTSDHETLFQSPQAEETVSLPLSVILPMLPSGKIELLAQDLAEYVPEGTMKSAEELGDYAYSPVALPLQEIISRIPEDAMVLRTDQKPIDDSVAQMDDPFSAEMLAAAQEAAAVQAGEQGFDVNAIEEPGGTHAENLASAPDPQMPDPEEASDQMREPAAEPGPSPDLPEAPEPIEPSPEAAPASTGQEDVDFSFTQSEEYQKFLSQMESEQGEAPVLEEEAVQEEPPVADPEIPAAPADEGAISTEEPPSAVETDVQPTEQIPQSPGGQPQEVSDYDDPADGEMTAPIPRPVQESYDKMASADDESREAKADASEDAEVDEADNPLFAPTRIVPKKKPKAEASPKSPGKEAAAPVPSAGPGPKPVGFKLPPPPVSKAEAKAKLPVPPKPALPQPPQEEEEVSAPESESSSEDLVVSSQLANMLGIRDHEPSIKDIVRQINCWPGMKGCIVGGKDGLRISSDVDDDSFANSISAFAPKLISRISELFNDLGFSEVEELHTPVQDSSVYIFRKNSLYLIVLFEDASFPESYRNLVKRVLDELNNSKESNSI